MEISPPNDDNDDSDDESKPDDESHDSKPDDESHDADLPLLLPRFNDDDVSNQESDMDTQPDSSPNLNPKTEPTEDQSDEDLPPLVRRDDSRNITQTPNHMTAPTDDESDEDIPPLVLRDNSRKFTKTAPYRLVNFKNLKDVVENNLTTCKVCKGSALELCDGEIRGLDMELLIRCAGCDIHVQQIKNGIKYLRQKLRDTGRATMFERKEVKRIYSKIRYYAADDLSTVDRKSVV